MREKMIEALKAHALGHIEKHKVNVEVILQKAVGIGEHGDIIETIEKELNIIAQYEDQLEVLEKHFEALKEAEKEGNVESLKEILKKVVSGFTPEEQIADIVYNQKITNK